MKPAIQSVEASYLVHMTEDPEKVGSAVARLLSTDAKPQVEELEGHFGNSILRGSVRLTGEDAWQAFESVLSKMGPALAREVAADAESFIDEHSAMFLRFDKQALVGGSLVLGYGDPVRVKVKPRAHQMKGRASTFFRQLMQGG